MHREESILNDDETESLLTQQSSTDTIEIKIHNENPFSLVNALIKAKKIKNALDVLAARKSEFPDEKYLSTLAHLHFVNQNFKEAELNCRAALTLYDGKPVNKTVISLIKKLAKINLKLSDFKTSAHYFQKALAYALALQDFPKLKLVQLYIDLGEVYRDLNQPALSIRYIKQAIAIETELDSDKIGLASDYFSVGELYKQISVGELEDEDDDFDDEEKDRKNNAEVKKLSTAIQYFDKAYSTLLDIKQNNDLFAVDCKMQIAECHADMKQSDQSIIAYEEALAICLRLQETPEVKNKKADILNDIGVEYLAAKDLTTAERCLLDALQIRENIKAQLDMAHTYNNLAMCAVAAGHNGQAYSFLNRALTVINDLGIDGENAVFAGRYYVHLARVHESLFEAKSALTCYKRAVEIFNKFNVGAADYFIECRSRIRVLQPQPSLLQMCRELFPCCNRKLNHTEEDKGLSNVTQPLS